MGRKGWKNRKRKDVRFSIIWEGEYKDSAERWSLCQFVGLQLCERSGKNWIVHGKNRLIKIF